MDNLSFIIVDDSELDCFIASKIIKQSGARAGITTFLQAKDTLKHLQNKDVANGETSVVLLDIIMPLMSGFEFLDEFKKLAENVRSSCYIIAITSSMNKKYIGRIPDYEEVKGVIDKPITSEKFELLLEQISSHLAH